MTELLRFDATSTLSAETLAGEGDADTDIKVLNTDTVQALAEQAFETRLRPLLQRGEVASRAEIERLTQEVEVLTRRVEALCRERKREDATG